MDVKHTPGPWRVEIGGEEIVVEGCGNPAGTIAVVAGRKSVEIEANARLIAAVPDLLDELEAIVDFVEQYAYSLDVSGYIASARAAIVKAKEGTK